MRPMWVMIWLLVSGMTKAQLLFLMMGRPARYRIYIRLISLFLRMVQRLIVKAFLQQRWEHLVTMPSTAPVRMTRSLSVRVCP